MLLWLFNNFAWPLQYFMISCSDVLLSRQKYLLLQCLEMEM